MGEARLDLPVDLGREAVGVVEAHAAGVDEVDHATIQLDPLHEPVTGHTLGGVLDGDPPLDEPVEQARLAHVGPADDDDLGGHGFRLRRREGGSHSRAAGCRRHP